MIFEVPGHDMAVLPAQPQLTRRSGVEILIAEAPRNLETEVFDHFLQMTPCDLGAGGPCRGAA